MRRGRKEEGQILPVVAFALVVLLGISAFAIDIGYAYYAKRQLQSAVDAAALAGAQDLPNATNAIATAQSYAAANTPSNVSFTLTYETKCTATAVIATGCSAAVNPNALVVTATATTTTWFSGLFGIKHLDVSTHANACSPCSSTPVDIVVAIDRTGSMCDQTDSGGCRDLNNAKDGVRTMLRILNPPYAEVGMVAFPPVQATSTSACAAPYNSLGNNGYDGYDVASRGYVTDSMATDYKKADGTLNSSSGLYLHTQDGRANACIQAGGNTSYSEALRQAQAELDDNGRPNVPDYIVFLTDGEANIGSVYGPNDASYPPGNSDDQQPCHTAINLASAYKAQGTTIYSIGYNTGNHACTAGDWPTVVVPGIPGTPAIPATPDIWNNKHTKIITPGTPAVPAVPAVPASSRPCDPGRGDHNCYHTADDHAESPSITSTSTLSQIASTGDFYNQPTPGQLDSVFAAIATDIGSGSSRLVDDGF
jgi:Flp pilus assembly protein TadG